MEIKMPEGSIGIHEVTAVQVQTCTTASGRTYRDIVITTKDGTVTLELYPWGDTMPLSVA